MKRSPTNIPVNNSSILLEQFQQMLIQSLLKQALILVISSSNY